MLCRNVLGKATKWLGASALRQSQAVGARSVVSATEGKVSTAVFQRTSLSKIEGTR